MTKERPLNLMQIQANPTWWEDDNSRVRDLFHSGDAVLLTAKTEGVNVENFIQKYHECGNPELGKHPTPLDNQLAAFIVNNNNKTMLVLNPNVNVLRDIMTNTERWASCVVVNSADYADYIDQSQTPKKEGRTV